MKNKTKKIIAGLGLALIGGATLTGCSMTEAQQKALDKVVDKTDEIIELVENNMAMQNAKLTKEEAAEKIMLARNYFLSKNLNIKMHFKHSSYEGLYDKEYDSSDVDCYFIKNKDVLKYVNFSDGINYISAKMDFKNDIYYYCFGGEGNRTFHTLEYSSCATLGYAMQIDVLLNNAEIGGIITPDMIVDLNIIEGGYEFFIYSYSFIENGAQRSKVKLKLVDNRITDFDIERTEITNSEIVIDDDLSAEEVFVELTHNYESNVDVQTFNGAYHYDLETSISVVDAELAAIESECLAD
jgi:hypothetical protein